MSELTIQRAAPSRALAVLALVGLGCWAALTVVIGVGDMVNGVRNVSFLTAPPGTLTESDVMRGDAANTLSVTLFVFWILSLNLVLVATVLGVADLVLVRRSWRRSVAFAAVAVAGPVAALVVNQVANRDGDFASTSYLEAIVPGLALVVVALAALVVAWRLLYGAGTDAVPR
jgi:hypothetical protein